jgi:hypothetical protein
MTASALKGSRLRVDDVGKRAMQPEETPPIQPSAPAPSFPQVELGGHEQQLSTDGICPPERLHVCFHCAGELAYPLDWSEEGPRHWRILLRCPECESRREGVFEQAAVEQLDDELDRAAGALLGDLRRMTHANMSEEVEFFVRALDADLIVPSDF